MEFTVAATWLNTAFAGFDNAILEFMHTLEEAAGGFITPLAKFITLIGEKGLWMFALAFVLMMFAKTRKLGICLFGAVCCGALITNIILTTTFLHALVSFNADNSHCPSSSLPIIILHPVC